MTIDRRDITRRVLALTREAGFALSGVAPALPIDHHRELIQWLDAGRHGEMAWMADHLAQRIDPRKKLVGAKSIVAVADRYAGGEPDEPRPGEGRIARYARGNDYHRVVKDRLHAVCDRLRAEFPSERFVACVDTAPVLEREHAVRAGLGYVGKNTMLIEPGVGGYLLLGEILTTLDLEPHEAPMPDYCGTCTRCLDACPTDALTPYALDAVRCISYLTIEHRGPIAPEFHEPMGDWIFGCDICQEVCPHNGDTPRTREASKRDDYAARHQGFDLLAVLGWTEASRQEAFVRSALKRAKLGMMKRNALIAAGNRIATHGDPRLETAVRRIAEDESEPQLVRDTACAVLRRVGMSA